MTHTDVTMKLGDTEPALIATVFDETGDPLDLTEATARFRMANTNTGERIVNRPAIIQDPPNGQLAYDWGADDTDEEGLFSAEFSVDFDGNIGDDFDGDETFPSNKDRQFIYIEILDSLK